jgi:hypothetical protein
MTDRDLLGLWLSAQFVGKAAMAPGATLMRQKSHAPDFNEISGTCE